MANLFRSLISRRQTDEVARFSTQDYLRWLSTALNGLVQPMYPSTSTYSQGRPAERIENSFTGYVYGAYKVNPIVYGLMTRRSSVFSEARFMWREVLDGKPGDLFWNADLGVLSKPWPNGTTGELLTRMIQDVDLAGNSYIVNEGDRLRRLRPDWVQIILSGNPLTEPDVDVVGYTFTPGGPDAGEPVAYMPDEVSHWSPIPDPDAQYRGMSWLTPVVREIQGDQAATSHKLAFYRNGASLGPIIRLPKEMTPEQFRKFIEADQAAHAGAENAYRTMYVGGGADVTLAAANMQQLDFKAVQGAGETRLCVASGVPAVIAGVSEGLSGSSLNAGNYGTAKRSFADGTLRTLWRSACAALSTILQVPEDAELWYDESHIAFLREDQQDQAQIDQTTMATIVSGITGGFEPDAVVTTVRPTWSKTLKHSGLMSVQLTPPGSDPTATIDGTDQPPPDDGVPPDQARSQSDVDEEFYEVLWAIGDVIERAFNPDQARISAGHVGGGEFGSKVTALLEHWLAQGGKGDPLGEAGVSRQTIVKTAKAHGVHVPPRMPLTALKAALYAAVHERAVTKTGGTLHPEVTAHQARVRRVEAAKPLAELAHDIDATASLEDPKERADIIREHITGAEQAGALTSAQADKLRSTLGGEGGASKVKAAVTRLNRANGVTLIGSAEKTTTFDPAQHRPLVHDTAADSIEPGTRVRVVAQGWALDGETVEKARVAPVGRGAKKSAPPPATTPKTSMPSYSPPPTISAEDQARAERLVRADPQIFATAQERHGRISNSGNLSEEDAAWLQTLVEREPAFVNRLAQQASLERDVRDKAKKAGQTPTQYRASVAAKLKDALAGKPIAIRVRDEDALQAILAGGRFKTQHEGVKRAPGLGVPGGLANRRLGEEIQGVPAGTPATEKPVYGYVAVNGVEPALSPGRKIPGIAQREGQEDVLSSYGQVQVVLKPEVRARTTATVGDSLDMVGFLRPSPVDNPTADSLGYYSVDDLREPGWTRRAYVEAQIHGGVATSDIERVVFAADPSPALAARLDEQGIPWQVLRSGDAALGPTTVSGVGRPPRKAAPAKAPSAGTPAPLEIKALTDAFQAGHLTAAQLAAALEEHGKRTNPTTDTGFAIVHDLSGVAPPKPKVRAPRKAAGAAQNEIPADTEATLRALEEQPAAATRPPASALSTVRARHQARLDRLDAVVASGYARRRGDQYVLTPKGQKALTDTRTARLAREADAVDVPTQRVDGGNVTANPDTAAAVMAAADADPRYHAPRGGEDLHGDLLSQHLAAAQGFDGPPQLASREQFDALVRTGGVDTVLYRGVEAGAHAKTAAEIQQEFRVGPLHVGLGTFGNGMYMATNQSHADAYGDGTPGAVARFGLRADARVVTWDELGAEFERFIVGHPEGTPERALYGDVGRYAMARGYDAISIRKGQKPGFGDAAAGNQYVVLNRTALVAEVPDGTATLAATRRGAGRPPELHGRAAAGDRSRRAGGNLGGAAGRDQGSSRADRKPPGGVAAPAPGKKLTAADAARLTPAELQQAVADGRVTPRVAEQAGNLMEQAVRERHAQINAKRQVAETVAEVHELVDNETGPAAIASRLRAAQTRRGVDTSRLQELAHDPHALAAEADRMAAEAGLTRIGPPPRQAVPFDRHQHKPIGGGIGDGAAVEVVRPGYVWTDPEGKQVKVADTLVEETGGSIPAAPTLTPGTSAPRRALSRIAKEHDLADTSTMDASRIRDEASAAWQRGDSPAQVAALLRKRAGELAKERYPQSNRVAEMSSSELRTARDGDVRRLRALADTVEREPVQAEAPGGGAGPKADTAAAALDVAGYTPVEGARGAVRAPDGTTWKIQGHKTENEARQATLAAALYRAAGVDVAETVPAVGARGVSGHQTATRVDDGVRRDFANRPADALHGRLREGFALDAWLGNAGVVGEGRTGSFAGIGTTTPYYDPSGKPIRLDPGTLTGPKGASLGPVVTEWDSLRDPTQTKNAAIVFAPIDADAMRASAARVEAITPDQIRAMVSEHGLPPAMADTLVARRADIISRANSLPAANSDFTENAHTDWADIRSATPGRTSELDASSPTAAAFEEYKGDDAFREVNGGLLRGTLGPTSRTPRAFVVRAIDDAMAQSHLTHDVVVYRGERNPGRNFPPGQWSLVGGMEGMEWEFPAYASTTAHETIADEFARSDVTGRVTATRQPTVLRIRVAAGTSAVAIDPPHDPHAKGSAAYSDEAEVLLNRGLRYRVVRDYGLVGGVRRMDVEVVR